MEGYKYHLERTGKIPSRPTATEQDPKKRKLHHTIIDVESDDDDLLAWIAELPEDISDMTSLQGRAYQDLTVPETPARSEPNQTEQPGVPDYLRIMVHFLTKMNNALDTMTTELRDTRKEMHELKQKVSGKTSEGKELMNEDGAGNDSNYLNLYLSSSTRQIAEITSKISSEFISINRKQERSTQCISDLQNNMNTFIEGIMN